MATVLGNNLTLYVGDGMRTIGCEDSCTLSIENQLINVTTKGSGRGTNREYGGYDWNLQASGVIFINSSFDGSGSNLDPFEFLAYSLQGKKVVCKFQQTDGSTTKWVIGNGVISTCSYVGQAGEHGMYNVVILADGLLYPSTNIISRDAYDGPSVYIYTATGTGAGFTASELISASTLYFIHRGGNGSNRTYQTSEIETLPDALSSPVTAGAVGYHAASGTINFNIVLASGDIIFVSYDTSD